MRARTVAAVLAAVLACGPARADEEPPVVPLDQGQPAPFSGLLVPEGRMAELLGAEIDADDLNRRLEIQATACARVEAVYAAKLQEASKPPPWHESPSFNRWAGFAIGIAAASAAIWGASTLAR